MNTKTISIAVRICLLWLALPVLVRAADPDALELEVVPQTLEVGPCGQDSPLLVVVRNRGKNAVSELQLSLLTDVPLEFTPPKPDVKSVTAQQQTIWQFNVRCTSEFPASSLQVVVSGKVSGDKGPITQIVDKSIPVKLREPQALESVAAIDIKSTLDSLTESDEGEIVVVVSNKTKRPIKVCVTPSGPKFIKLTPVQSEAEAQSSSPCSAGAARGAAGKPATEKSNASPERTVDGLRTEAFTFIATANGRVQPGKQLLLFQVHLATDRDKRDFLITREVSVGIIGSEILKALGVPSFFFLPGFLALSGFILFWKWHVLRPGGSNESPLDEKSFWLVAITASLIISSLFRLLWRRDVFSFYRLGDVMIMWAASIAIGLTVYLVYRLIANGLAKRKQAKQERLDREKYPQTDDSPLAILKKMHAYGLKMGLEKVKLKDSTNPAFMLLSNSDGSFYVCPGMVLTWDPATPATIRDPILDQLDNGGDPQIVAGLIETAKKPDGSSMVHLEWAASNRNSHPQKITKDALEQTLGTRVVLQQGEKA
jgi:hypothetical protein